MDAHEHSKPEVKPATDPPISDYVILCCFGPALDRVCHRRQLSAALHRAGFRGPQVRYLIRTSPILLRGTKRRYRLKRCDESCGVAGRRVINRTTL
jgi:hypothetical protein